MRWKRNPVVVLLETYRLLNMDGAHAAAVHRIWDHDRELLATASAFYAKLRERTPAALAWPEFEAALRTPAPAFGLDHRAGSACARRTPGISSGSTSSRCCR